MILIAFGTRPEYIKFKPILDIFRKKEFKKYKILFTGQHENLVSIPELKIDNSLEILSGENRLDSIFVSVLNKNYIFNDITHVIVQGDTATAYAVALAAFHRNISVIHLEAGLRTYDIKNPYPEEYYRRCISNLASINLCVSKIGKNNLETEKVPGDIFVVGNTVLDNLVGMKTEYENKILVTLHRRENHSIIDKWFEEIENIANRNKDYEFLLPIHPNPNVQKFKSLLKTVKVIEPLEHKELLSYLSKCKLLITDSGGLQEESSFFGKKSIVCRKETERKEGLGTFSFLCKEPKRLEKLFSQLLTNYQISDNCPYGNGKSAEIIYEIVRKVV